MRGEEITEALKRMFFAGWAGRYGATRGGYPLPSWFSSLGEHSPYIFFAKLAQTAAGLYLKKVEESELVINREVVVQKLNSHSELTGLNVDTVTRYLKGLVLNHRSGREVVWSAAIEEMEGPVEHKTQSFPRRLVAAFDSYAREIAKDRAAEAFKVLNEAWALKWITSPDMRALIAARVRDQLSLQETATRQGWSSEYVGTLQGRMLKAFPEMATFSPQKAASARSI